MVIIKAKPTKNNPEGKWDLANRKMETVIIDSTIKKEFAEFAKKHNINKSKLIEEFYRTILIKMSTLNISQGYITINIFNSQKRR